MQWPKITNFKRGRDGFAWAFLAISAAVVGSSIAFFLTDADNVDISILKVKDAVYIDMLLAFFSVKNVDVTKLSLESLGSYEIFTNVLTDAEADAKYSLPKVTGTVQSRIRTWRADSNVQRVLADKTFTASTIAPVTMVSPMWFYEHNMHLVDDTYCTVDNVKDAITTIRKSTGSTDNRHKCAPSQPTMVNYRGCYQTIQTRKEFFLFYSIATGIMFLLTFVAYVFFSLNGNTMAGMFAEGFYMFSPVLYTLGCVILGLELWNDNNSCPHAETGVANLFTLLIVSFIFSCISLTMLVVKAIYGIHERINARKENFLPGEDDVLVDKQSKPTPEMNNV